jgi:hypothetical protein
LSKKDLHLGGELLDKIANNTNELKGIIFATGFGKVQHCLAHCLKLTAAGYLQLGKSPSNSTIIGTGCYICTTLCDIQNLQMYLFIAI